jgi:hypothetical protein
LSPRCRGIWPSRHLNTAITLSVGVEAYVLRAWLDHSIRDRTRGFAKWSAICSSQQDADPLARLGGIG